MTYINTTVADIEKRFTFAEAFGVHGNDFVDRNNLGADKSTAFEQALENAISGGKTMLLPPGNIRLDKRIDYQEHGRLTVQIQGAGMAATKLLVNGAVNKAGALRITMTRAPDVLDLQLRDFTVAACDPSASAFTNCGRAIEVIRNPAPGLRALPELVMDRVGVESLFNDDGYFERQIGLEGVHWAKLNDVRANQLLTANLSDHANRYRSNWIAYRPESALYVRNCYGLHVEGGIYRCGGGNIGFGQGAPIYIDTTGGAEGGTFRHVTSNFGTIGVRYTGVANEPGFNWQGGHINFRDVGFAMDRGRSGFIYGCLMYMDDGTAQGVDNTDSSTTPRCFDFGTQSDGWWDIYNNSLFYAAHKNIGNSCFVWTRAPAGRQYRVFNNTINETAQFGRGFFSNGNRQSLFAWGNQFGRASNQPYWNGFNAGYQHHTDTDNRTVIFGRGVPSANASDFPTSIEVGTEYVDTNAVMTDGRYRVASVASSITWIAL